jgi:hypothetical protein
MKEDEMDRACSLHGSDEKCICNIFVRRPRCSWEDTIRMDFREIGWEGMDWMHPAQDRVQ